MWFYFRYALSVWKQKKGQDSIPGWMFVVGLILGLAFLVFMVWFAMKSGKASKGAILGFG